MRSVDEIFGQSTLIVESIDYFDPTKNLVDGDIITEGVVGTVVEKIKALLKFIKDWFKKLIASIKNRIAGRKKAKKSESNNSGNNKTDNKKTGKEKEKEIAKKCNDAEKENEDVAKKAISGSKNDRKALNPPQDREALNSPTQQKQIEGNDRKGLPAPKINNGSIEKALSVIDKNIKNTEAELKKLHKELKAIETKINTFDDGMIEIPNIRPPREAISKYTNDVVKILRSDSPAESYRLKIDNVWDDYFIIDKSTKKISMDEYNKTYANQSEIILQNISMIEKLIDGKYQVLINAATKASEEGDTEEANEILENAKKINSLLQKVGVQLASAENKYESQLNFDANLPQFNLSEAEEERKYLKNAIKHCEKSLSKQRKQRAITSKRKRS